MRFRRSGLMLAAAMLFTASALPAQQTGGLGAGALSGLMGGGGASSLLGGLMPSVGSTSASNAAGVLSYCVKNKLVGSTSAVTSALQGLTGKQGVTASPQYAAGQQGTLVTGKGSTLSLDDLKGKVKTKVCDLVLQHARSML